MDEIIGPVLLILGVFALGWFVRDAWCECAIVEPRRHTHVSLDRFRDVTGHADAPPVVRSWAATMPDVGYCPYADGSPIVCDCDGPLPAAPYDQDAEPVVLRWPRVRVDRSPIVYDRPSGFRDRPSLLYDQDAE